MLKVDGIEKSYKQGGLFSKQRQKILKKFHLNASMANVSASSAKVGAASPRWDV